MSNPNAVLNLKKRGAAANPNGRPKKGYSITETIRSMLTARPEIKQELGNKILEMALKGDITAIKTLWQYMDGMPKQGLELAGPEGKSLFSMTDFIMMIAGKTTQPNELSGTATEQPDKLD